MDFSFAVFGAIPRKFRGEPLNFFQSKHLSSFIENLGSFHTLAESRHIIQFISTIKLMFKQLNKLKYIFLQTFISSVTFAIISSCSFTTFVWICFVVKFFEPSGNFLAVHVVPVVHRDLLALQDPPRRDEGSGIGESKKLSIRGFSYNYNYCLGFRKNIDHLKGDEKWPKNNQFITFTKVKSKFLFYMGLHIPFFCYSKVLITLVLKWIVGTSQL